MRKRISTIILVIMLLLGLSLLLYPAVSNYVNTRQQTSAISDYLEQTANLTNEEYEKMLKEAQEYNKMLAERNGDFNLSYEEKQEYYSTLNVTDDGLMSYVDIPSIDCTLPIYHGTSDTVLQAGAGHIEGSSLPVGGESTHCVILAHRGLPSAKLFSALDKLNVGDTFTLNTLGETLTYEVDQILIVLPDDTSNLRIEEGEDYCTLVTCTPYGINTHRLLVRGKRVEDNGNSDANVHITADAMQIEPMLIAPFVAFVIAAIMLTWFLAGTGTRKPKKERKHKREKSKDKFKGKEESG
jgi:sortase A